jgi:SSS family solute:Na+ symporter
MVANAPDGLYQLMQQLNGIFFIPIASVLIAGFFIPQISATGAKVGLGTGLSFYLLTTFVLEVNLHFIHIWGIEFILNLMVMYLVSLQFPPITKPSPISKSPVDLKEWRFAKHLSVILCLVTVLIYYWLGR